MGGGGASASASGEEEVQSSFALLKFITEGIEFSLARDTRSSSRSRSSSGRGRGRGSSDVGEILGAAAAAAFRRILGRIKVNVMSDDSGSMTFLCWLWVDEDGPGTSGGIKVVELPIFSVACTPQILLLLLLLLLFPLNLLLFTSNIPHFLLLASLLYTTILHVYTHCLLCLCLCLVSGWRMCVEERT